MSRLDTGVLAASLALLVLGLARAGTLAWICDDAFISLRYADHLVSGYGLVYNPGEFVEGYTNLLWTLALAAALRLGAPDVASAEWMGIACYAALAIALFAASWRRHRHHGTPFAPLAAGVVLVSPDFHVWASGGLETSLFALLALLGALAARGAASDARRALLAGLLFSLLTLTRPDGLLLAGVATLALWPFGRSLRAAALVAAPVAVTVLVWGAWKLDTYGELLPTAFYSKSVLRPYYSQGLVYLGLYLARNWFLPVALLAVGFAVWRWRPVPRPGAADAGSVAIAPGAADAGSVALAPGAADAGSVALAAGALLYLLYVVHVGGDFMYARRIVPVVPLLLLAIEELLLRRVPERLGIATAAVCVAGAALPYPVFDADTPRIRGVADERRFYPESAIEKRRLQAEAVAFALAGTDARVMFEGGMCVFGYYSGLPYLVEMSGLTQYSLARLPLGERGLIGHEKEATDAWLDENDIHLIVSHRFPPIPQRVLRGRHDLLLFGNVALARIHRYDDAVMDPLREIPGVVFVPIERLLERSRRDIARASPERGREILAELERYYLDGAGERGRAEAAALRALIEEREKPR